MHKDISLLNRFKNASEELAIGKGDVRSRLKDIYLYVQPIRENELPKKFQNKWHFVKN